MNNIVCPVSSEQVNENAGRVTAGIIFVLISLFVLTDIFWFLLFALFDFTFRIFEKSSFSPVSYFVNSIFKFAKLPVKKTDKAPKIFAARLGFFMTLLSVAFYFFFPVVSYVIVVILGICIFADAVFNYCIGCVIYHYFVFPFYKKKQRFTIKGIDD